MKRLILYLGLVILFTFLMFGLLNLKDYSVVPTQDGLNKQTVELIKPLEMPKAVEVALVARIAPVASTCEREIAKYNWNHNTALAVARAESGLSPIALNNDPSTGDYSVGCLQINIYGGNARTRPSEQELYDPVINVAFAYRLYVGNGSSFIGQWGVCRGKVQCY